MSIAYQYEQPEQPTLPSDGRDQSFRKKLLLLGGLIVVAIIVMIIVAITGVSKSQTATNTNSANTQTEDRFTKKAKDALKALTQDSTQAYETIQPDYPDIANYSSTDFNNAIYDPLTSSLVLSSCKSPKTSNDNGASQTTFICNATRKGAKLNLIIATTENDSGDVQYTGIWFSGSNWPPKSE